MPHPNRTYRDLQDSRIALNKLYFRPSNSTMTHKKPTRMTLASSNSYLTNSYDHSRENLFGQIFGKAVALFEKHPVIGFLIIVALGVLVN